MLQNTREESKRVRECITDKRLGLKYGTANDDVVDMFGEQSNTTGQLMVYISGGYWQELSGDISAYTVQPLVTSGHTVAVVHYTRCPGQDLASIIGQIVRCGQWILQYAKQRNLQVFLSGTVHNEICLN